MSDGKDARLMDAAEFAELEARMQGRGSTLSRWDVVPNALNTLELNRAEIASLDRLMLGRGDYSEADCQALDAAYHRQHKNAPTPSPLPPFASPPPLPRASSASWPDKDARHMTPAELADLDARMKSQF